VDSIPIIGGVVRGIEALADMYKNWNEYLERGKATVKEWAETSLTWIGEVVKKVGEMTNSPLLQIFGAGTIKVAGAVGESAKSNIKSADAYRNEQIFSQLKESQKGSIRFGRENTQGYQDARTEIDKILSLKGIQVGTEAWKAFYQQLKNSNEVAQQGKGLSSSVDLVKGFEGFISKAKWDVNHYRVGYGSDTTTRADGTVQVVGANTEVNSQDAERDLTRRIKQFQNGIRQKIGGVFDQYSENVQAALTSIAYNYGSLPSNVAQAARTGNTEAIARAIESRKGDNAGVNSKRRQKEANLVRTGSTGAPSVQPPSGESDSDQKESERKAKEAQREREQALEVQKRFVHEVAIQAAHTKEIGDLLQKQYEIEDKITQLKQSLAVAPTDHGRDALRAKHAAAEPRDR